MHLTCTRVCTPTSAPRRRSPATQEQTKPQKREHEKVVPRSLFEPLNPAARVRPSSASKRSSLSPKLNVRLALGRAVGTTVREAGESSVLSTWDAGSDAEGHGPRPPVHAISTKRKLHGDKL